jgi:hypothetical protein
MFIETVPIQIVFIRIVLVQVVSVTLMSIEVVSIGQVLFSLGSKISVYYYSPFETSAYSTTKLKSLSHS